MSGGSHSPNAKAGTQAVPASRQFNLHLYYSQTKPNSAITGRQVTLRSLTVFFFDRFAIGLRWAAAQTYLRDFIPQTPFFASRGFQPLDINSITSQSR